MKLTFLGTGTSHGVPVIACDCAVCKSKDPHNKRTRQKMQDPLRVFLTMDKERAAWYIEKRKRGSRTLIILLEGKRYEKALCSAADPV